MDIPADKSQDSLVLGKAHNPVDALSVHRLRSAARHHLEGIEEFHPGATDPAFWDIGREDPQVLAGTETAPDTCHNSVGAAVDNRPDRSSRIVAVHQMPSALPAEAVNREKTNRSAKFRGNIPG